jgi:hypothetical protein
MFSYCELFQFLTANPRYSAFCDVRKSKHANADVWAKASLCETLGMNCAALNNEGFVVHTPDQSSLLSALESAQMVTTAIPSSWRFVSNRTATADALDSVDAVVSRKSTWQAEAAAFLAFFPDDVVGDGIHGTIPH